MNHQYTYFLILAASLAGPLALSFDKKVTFYKKWQPLFKAMLLPALFYIAWDIYFTSTGVWRFNENCYVLQLKVFNLPLEEVLFFFIVPYCCVFIYECIRCYFPSLKNKKAADVILQVLALVLAITGLVFYDRQYTAYTFLLTAAFIAGIYIFRSYVKEFDATSFLVSFVIVLLPFLVVNGFLTAIPVVLYNNAENLGIRIYTIPFEDTFYGMLLMLMNVVLYEKTGNRKAD